MRNHLEILAILVSFRYRERKFSNMQQLNVELCIVNILKRVIHIAKEENHLMVQESLEELGITEKENNGRILKLAVDYILFTQHVLNFSCFITGTCTLAHECSFDDHP